MPEAIPPHNLAQSHSTTLLLTTNHVVLWSMVRHFYVYIMANQRKTVLYTGVTNDLVRRVWDHRKGQGSRFTAKYQCAKLVFYEVFADPYNAIAREKQIKGGSRKSKVKRIENVNPTWRDLYREILR